MEDIVQPLFVILVGGLFAPLLTQLLENFLKHSRTHPAESQPILSSEERKKKKQRAVQLFAYAVVTQLLLFTIFFFTSKWIYFDKNYFKTSEQELIREGLKKGKDYVISKITIRIYSEDKNGIYLSDSTCSGKKVNYCSLISISYEIVALRDFNSEIIFPEYYEAIYASKVIKEPGSEEEGDDRNPKDNICDYDLKTTLKKFERKTIVTRADYLYDQLPEARQFFDKEFAGYNWDMFYYTTVQLN